MMEVIQFYPWLVIYVVTVGGMFIYALWTANDHPSAGKGGPSPEVGPRAGGVRPCWRQGAFSRSPGERGPGWRHQTLGQRGIAIPWGDDRLLPGQRVGPGTGEAVGRARTPSAAPSSASTTGAAKCG